MKTFFSNFKLIGVTVCMLVFSFVLNAATRTASVSGLWSNTATWGGAAVPVAGDDVIINSSVSVTQNVSTPNLLSLTINSGGTLTSSGAVTLSATTFNLNGTYTRGSTGNITVTTMSVGSTGTYTHGINGGTIPTATWNNTSTCNITGISNSLPGGLNQSLGNFTWNCSAQTASLTLAGSPSTIGGSLSIANTNTGSLLYASSNATLTINGNLSISNGTFNLVGGNNNTVVINLSGNINVSGGILDMMISGNTNTSSKVNVTGDFTHTAGTIRKTDNAGSGTFVFNKSGIQVYTSGGTITNTPVNFTVNSGSTLQMFDASSVITGGGTFTLSSGATIGVTSAAGLTNAGATGNIQTSTRSYSTGANYIYNGSSAQVTGNGLPATINSLTINNPTGVTLDATKSMNGTLDLSNGVLTTTTTNLLTLNTGSSATFTDGSTTSFINGPMAKVGTTAFVFPVGKTGSGGGMRSIGISAPSVSSTFRAEFNRATAPNRGSVGSGITQVSACEHWVLDRTAGTGTTEVTLSWSSVSSCNGALYVTNLSDLRVARYNGSQWTDAGNAGTTGDNGNGTITSAPVATFSSFALGSANSGTNPLPVKFNDVKAFEKDKNVQIEWTNLTEFDVDNYEIERSSNGIEFAVIATVSAKGNLGSKESYQRLDIHPVQGVNFYRIKANENNGKALYSQLLKVMIGEKIKTINLYPNPVQGNTVTFNFAAGKGQYIVRIVNGIGQQLFTQTLNHQGGTLSQSITLPSTIKRGIYNLFVTGENYKENKAFIVQ